LPRRIDAAEICCYQRESHNRRRTVFGSSVAKGELTFRSGGKQI
jgi:hypothetical protein